MTEADLLIDTTLLPNFYHKVLVNTGQNSIQRILHFVILEPDKGLPLSIKDKTQNASRLMLELILVSRLWF